MTMADVRLPNGCTVYSDACALSIDPGPTTSGFLVYDLEQSKPLVHGEMPNENMVREVGIQLAAATVVIERLTGYGQIASGDEFLSAEWGGRFFQRAKDSRLKAEWVTRREVKLNLLGRSHGTDANVRGALLERFGGEHAALARAKRCSRKKHGAYGAHPDCGCGGSGLIGVNGPMVGIGPHARAALAVAVTYQDRVRREAQKLAK